MTHRIRLGDVEVEVIRKGIRNIHLSVYPPSGAVRITAPNHMVADAIRLFAISKLDWIRRHQRRLQAQERETPRDYVCRESHFLWGKRYLLDVVEKNAPAGVSIEHDRIRLQVRPGSDAAARLEVMEVWYRDGIRAAIPDLASKWEHTLGVKVDRVYVQRMKTLWGSCNPRARSIRLNTELAKKPAECLEYIWVHELVHLLEPSHNARFKALMDGFLPAWRRYREVLNRLPVHHEEWRY